MPNPSLVPTPPRSSLSAATPAARIARAVAEILDALGEDGTRAGLRETPDRVARAFAELTAGYGQDPADVIGDAIFDEPGATGDAPVIVSDIEFHSLCEHHMLPFHGVAHVAYLPAGRVVGLSKLPRLVEVYARRLQVQERITAEVADALESILRPRGVAVVLEATHACMAMRGVRSQRSRTTSFAWRGLFASDEARRRELLTVIGPRAASER